MAAYDVSDANVYKIKWLENLGAVREGMLIIACLIRSNASLSLLPHLKTVLFLIIDSKGKKFVRSQGQIFKKIITQFP